MQYGYVDHEKLRSTEKTSSLSILSEDVKRFQQFAGLTPTGNAAW